MPFVMSVAFADTLLVSKELRHVALPLEHRPVNTEACENYLKSR
jgi:hypothetical protein